MVFLSCRKEYPPKISPKQKLYEATKRAGVDKPNYDVVGLFYIIYLFNF